MPRTVKWLALILLVFVPSAFSQQQQGANGSSILSYATGADLRKSCLYYGTTEKFSGDELNSIEFDLGYCSGFIAAVIASIDVRYWQPPNGHLPLSQAVAVVKKFIDDHPEQWGEPASSLVNNAIVQAFPHTE